MARISDVPHVIRTVGLIGFAKRVYQQISEDQIFTWGAALAYSWIFAIFPFLIFVLTLAPYLPYNTKETVTQELNAFIGRTMPTQAGETLQQNVERVMSEPRGGLLSVGLVFTIWVAAGGMAMTMAALDVTYDVGKPRPYWKQRLIAIGLTIVVAILILAVMLLLPVGTIILQYIDLFGFFHVVLNIARYALALALLFVVVALIYYFGPSIRSKFNIITPGAIFAIVVWLALAFVFRWYVNSFGRYDQMYGTVGGVAILLLLFYIDALVLLAGAEINSEIDFVALGMPSQADERPEDAAAGAAPMDEEKEELARELQSKRREDLGVSAIGKPQASATARNARPEPVPVPRAAGTNKWLVGLATLGVALLIDKVRQRSKRNAARISEPQRLRETYPVTYAALKGKNGSDGIEHDAH